MLELMIPRDLYPKLRDAANKRGVSIKKYIIETLIAHIAEQSQK